jgi:hypothetical protein
VVSAWLRSSATLSPVLPANSKQATKTTQAVPVIAERIFHSRWKRVSSGGANCWAGGLLATQCMNILSALLSGKESLRRSFRAAAPRSANSNWISGELWQ